MMLTDRELIINMAVERVEGEGDWQLPATDDSRAGEDDD